MLQQLSKKTNIFDDYGLEFQQQLIAEMVTNHTFGTQIIDIIEPAFFHNQYFGFIIKIIKEYYQTHELIPNYSGIEIQIRHMYKDVPESLKPLLDTLEKIQNCEFNNLNVRGIALNFCKLQRVKNTVNAVQKKLNTAGYEDYDEIEEEIKKAITFKEGNESSDIFVGIEDVLAKNYRNPIATGIKGLDLIMKGGLGKKEVAVIIAPLGAGKAQPLSAEILTPKGWVKMGNIRIGDDVIGSDGKSQKVIGVFPQGTRPIYNIEFNDNTSVLCDKEHLWAVNTFNQRSRKTRIKNKSVYQPNKNFKVLSTLNLMKDIKIKNGFNYRLPNVKPIDFINKDIIIDPYVFGVLLGDGCVKNNVPHITTGDNFIANKICNLYRNTSVHEYEGRKLNYKKLYKIVLLKSQPTLKMLGLYDLGSEKKFIPNLYLYNSLDKRVKLLQGLIDSDGYVSKSGTIYYSTVSEELATNIRELVLSLGGTVRNIKERRKTYNNKNGEKVYGRISYGLTISFPANGVIPCTLPFKLDRFRYRTKYEFNKFIKNITFSHNEEAQCILVENEDHLYVTNDYVLTHNTTLLSLISSNAYLANKNILHIFFEDNIKDVKRKYICHWSGIPLTEFDDNTSALLNVVKDHKDHPRGKVVFLKLQPETINVAKLHKYIKRERNKLNGKLDMVIIDYADCIVGERITDAKEWEGEGKIMRQIEGMADEFDVAIWTAVQGGRKSTTANLVEVDMMGGNIKKAQVAHFIMSVAKTLTQRDQKIATIAILKSRIGDDGKVFENCTFDNSRMLVDTSVMQSFDAFEQTQRQRNLERVRGVAVELRERQGEEQ